MKNWLLFFLLLATSISGQIDTKHWFAPVYDDQEYERTFYMLYLSTSESIPFNVKVFNGNKLLYDQKLSHDNPLILDLDKNDISTKDRKDALKVIQKGIYLEGDKKFLAQLRILTADSSIGTPQDAEIITSKGQLALGLNFMIGNIPNVIQETDINFQASVIATQDQTKLKFINIDPDLKFKGDSKILKGEILLNRGESFIVVGDVKFDQENLIGLLGTEIISDKPVVLTNGHFNGQYAYRLFAEKSDILLDQSVPINNLGNEYIAVKGISSLDNNMDRILIIGTENGTSVLVNNDSAQSLSLNKGDYIIVDRDFYKNGAVYLKGNKNFYAYQYFGSGSKFPAAFSSGGMVLLPPLDCYFKRNIDYIAYPDEIYSNYFNTKLNVITKRDATLKINGIPLDNSIKPIAISGTNDWIYYIIPNIKDKINSVTSTKGMYLQLIGGNNNLGYGASYSGFSKEPSIIISSTIDCVPGVELSIDNIFDNYQWQLEGVDIVGAKSATYLPLSQGNYSCKVVNDDCIALTLKEVYIFSCINSIDLTYDICSILNSDLSKVHPGFNLSTFEIINKPRFGKLTLKDGVLNYELTSAEEKIDSFKYKICDNAGLCYGVNVTLNINGSFLSALPVKYFLCKNESSKNLQLNQAYTSYLWSTGETTPSINVGLGEYHVDLDIGNCISRKYFKIEPLKTFSLLKVQVLQDQAIIFTSDETKKYLYSLDGLNFQISNTFFNLKSGKYKVFVKFDDNDCEIVEGEFVIFNIPNFLSPNGDGKNDIVDFSAFKDEKNSDLQILDRYGKIIYESKKDFKWTGKRSGKNLPSGTYWYILTFNDSISSEKISYQGYILLKTR